MPERRLPMRQIREVLRLHHEVHLSERQIARGCGVPCIGEELSHRGVIGPSWVFNVYSRLHGDANYKAGTYELRKNMGVSAAVSALKAGPHVAFVKLTIPPGLWLSQIAARVAR